MYFRYLAEIVGNTCVANCGQAAADSAAYRSLPTPYSTVHSPTTYRLATIQNVTDRQTDNRASQ